MAKRILFKKLKKCNFKGYFPFTVVTKYWPYSLCCTIHPWAYCTPNNLYLPLLHPHLAHPPLVTISMLYLRIWFFFYSLFVVFLKCHIWMIWYSIGLSLTYFTHMHTHMHTHTTASLSIHLLIRYLGCFHTLAIVNSAAINIGCIYYFQLVFSLFFQIDTLEWNCWVIWYLYF